MRRKFYRSGLNFTTSLIKTALSVGLGFVTTPFLLKWIGEESYGLYRLIFDYSGHISLLELGLGGALIPLMSKVGGMGSKQEMTHTLGHAMRAYLRLMPLFALAFILFYFFSPQMIQVQNIAIEQVQMAILLMGITSLFIPLNSFKVFLEARQRGDLVNISNTFQMTAWPCFSLLFAYIGMGVLSPFLALVLSLFINGLFIIFFSLRELAWPHWAMFWQTRDIELSKKIWARNWDHVLFNIAGKLSLYTDSIVLSWIMGPKAIVPFFLTSKLPYLVHGQLISIGNSVWASMLEMYHRGESEKFLAKFNEVNKFIMFLGVSALVPILIFNQYFVTAWVGDKNYAGEMVTLLASIVAISQAYASFWCWMLLGAEQVKRTKSVNLFNSVINIAVSIMATYRWGLLGPLLGSVCAYFIYQIPALLGILAKTFSVRRVESLMNIFPSLLFGIGVIFLGRFLVATLMTRSHLFLVVVSMALTSLIVLFMQILFLTKRSEKELWLARIKGLCDRFRS